MVIYHIEIEKKIFYYLKKIFFNSFIKYCVITLIILSVRLIILYLLFIWLFLNFDNLYIFLESLIGVKIEFMSFSYFYMILYFILFCLFLNPFGSIGSNLWLLRYEFSGLIFVFWFYAGFMNNIEL